MKNVLYILISILLTLLLTACTATKNEAVGSDVSNTEQSSNDTPNGQVKMETYVGADPNAHDQSNDNFELADTEIEWLDFETAIDRNKVEKKPLLIYVYTTWCTWCTKMNATTFSDQSTVDFVKENFHAVKVNPEEKKAIAYKEVLYEPKQFGNKVYNELIFNLLNGKMAFPSFVVLNKREVKREVISGYQSSQNLVKILSQYAD